MDVLEKNAFEKHWATGSVSAVDKEGWHILNHTERIWVKAGDVLVLWSWTGTAPVVEKLLRIEDFNLDLKTGITIAVKLADSSPAEQSAEITHQPQPISGTSVYMWVPYFSTLTWTPKVYKDTHAKRELTLGVCIRTQLDKTRGPRKGHHYVTTLAKFKTEWPNLQG